MAFDKIMSEYIRSLPKDPINLASISQYLNFIDYYKASTRLKHLLVIFLEFNIDLDLQSLSPHLHFLQLNSTSLNKASKASRTFYEYIHKNQLHINKQSI